MTCRVDATASVAVHQERPGKAVCDPADQIVVNSKAMADAVNGLYQERISAELYERDTSSAPSYIIAKLNYGPRVHSQYRSCYNPSATKRVVKGLSR
jgi:hypothetical protein